MIGHGTQNKGGSRAYLSPLETCSPPTFVYQLHRPITILLPIIMVFLHSHDVIVPLIHNFSLIPFISPLHRDLMSHTLSIVCTISSTQLIYTIPTNSPPLPYLPISSILSPNPFPHLHLTLWLFLRLKNVNMDSIFVNHSL